MNFIIKYQLFCLVLVCKILGPAAVAAENTQIEMKGNCFFNSTKIQKDVHLSLTSTSSFFGSPLTQGTLTVEDETYLVAEVDVRTPEMPAGRETKRLESTFETDLLNFRHLWPDRINSHVVRVFLGNIVSDVENKMSIVGSFILEDRQETPVPPGETVLRNLKSYDELTATRMAYLDDAFPGCALTQFKFNP